MTKMRIVILIITLLTGLTSYCQTWKPKYKVLFCDTIGNVLRIANATGYPKKGATVYVNKVRMRVINTEIGKYTYGNGLKGANIYVVKY